MKGLDLRSSGGGGEGHGAFGYFFYFVGPVYARFNRVLPCHGG